MEEAPTVSLWMIRWAAMMVSRYVVRKDCKTAFERARGGDVHYSVSAVQAVD